MFAVVVTAGLFWFQGRWAIENQLDEDRGQLVDAYRQATLMRTDRAGVYIQYAEALLVIQRNLGEAKMICSRGLKLNPDHAGGHYIMGTVLISDNRLTEGLRHLRKSLELDRENPIILSSAAATLIGLNRLDAQADQLPTTTTRLDEAIKLYRAAILLRPDNTDAVMELAHSLATHPDSQSRRPREAVKLARKGSAIMGRGHPAALRILALAYASAGQFDQATATVDEALARLEGQNAPSDEVMQIRRHREQFLHKQPPLPLSLYRT